MENYGYQYKSDFDKLMSIDQKHIWHPYTQHKIAPEPLLVKGAKGEFLYILDENGKEKKIIDGISSWWVNNHGHNHPYINQKIKDQLDNFEHAIFAGFTHEPAIKLVEGLIPLLPKTDLVSKHNRTLNKAFFSDDGSTSVEVGIKMAVQHWHNRGEDRSRIIALKDSYHGDTIGTMSSSDSPIFHQAFKKILFPVDFVDSPAYDPPAKGTGVGPFATDRRRSNNEIRSLQQIEALMQKNLGKVAAVLVEPLVQGAAGMKFYSTKFLQKLRELCDEYGVLLIADEVFTGFGRTGKMFACEKALIVPDIICLSKGLTGGYLPMGLTVTCPEIYSAFHSDSRDKTFFHGHSFTGNPLSCAAALASLELFKKEDRMKDVEYINSRMEEYLNTQDLWSLDIVKDIRIMGGIAAIELNDHLCDNYLSSLGPMLSAEFLKRHILLRPLGNVLYFIPPYTISVKSLEYCLESIRDVVFNLQ